MSRESTFIKRVELQPSQLDQAYQKALLIERNKFFRIKENDFVSIYGKERLESMKKRIADRENKMSREITKEVKRGMVFEIMILDLLQNFWYQDLKFIRSSKYDDYINGVDAIMTNENTTHPSALALSMDATNSYESLKKKSTLIKNHEGVTEIDFFQVGNFKGILNGVPHVALYMIDETFVQLLRLWLSEDKYHTSKTKLQNHEAQLIFLEQILYQLKMKGRKLQGKKELSVQESYTLETIRIYVDLIQKSLSHKTEIVKKQLSSDNNSIYEIDGILKSVETHPSLVAIKSLFA